MYMVRKKISASGNQERVPPSSMTAGQRIQRYQYDHTGARVKKVVDGVTTEYRMAGHLLVSEITNGQTFWYHYDSGANLISIVIGGKNYFDVRNLQNDVIALVDEDGNEAVSYTHLAEKTAEYQAEMTGRGLEESRWRLLTETYREESVERLREETGSYRSSRKAAADLRDSMREAIGNRKTPDREKLEREAEQAEERLEAAERARTMIRTLRKDNEEVYQSLQPRMEERRQAVSEHGRLDALYRMVSGNVSGSRMDLETYVQRYYLERILRAANRRFREMSAGQFELRMYGLEKAGEGKNRGLDLMVYSNVTGKEREVRTLSGGESFMAALSLALGMADQIRQSSAAIHLDMMFIDEGFGSLDEHSRNQAVKVLLRMAEGSRLIGIISHVTELKQEIEDQLIVTKDETGSHVRWQIS